MIKEEDLFEIKEQVDDAKSKVSELKGQQTATLKQLKEEFDCDTIEEAQKKLSEYEETQNVLDRKIKKGLIKLENELNKSEEDERED